MKMDWSLHKRISKAEWIWMVVCIVYLAAGVRMPRAIAETVDTPVGKLTLVVAALSLFTHSNPLVGVLGMLIAYDIMRRSAATTGSAAMTEYAVTEETKWKAFPKRHEFPYTLEQEMVKKYATVKFNTDYVKSRFRPAMDDINNAAYLKDLR